jgi:sodium/hydrogen exchanger 10/11
MRVIAVLLLPLLACGSVALVAAPTRALGAQPEPEPAAEPEPEPAAEPEPEPASKQLRAAPLSPHAYGGLHPHPHQAVVFPCVVCAMGIATSFALARWAPWVPYTVMLMVEGLLIGIVDHHAGSHGSLAHSLHMWQGIDPHLLLFAFLPALLFGDAMCMDTHVESQSFWQCFTLACPGVLLGAGLTALVAKFMLPYGWGWMISLTFGSILAATDPVAVVSLLKALGASPKLTVLIAGESLLNDGTAIVLFIIFCDLASQVINTPLDTVAFVARMAVAGPVIGFVCGYLILCALRRVRRLDGGEGPTKQAVITLVGAYLTFFVAENELGSSGVLATVCAAQVIAHSGWPVILDHENMEAVWKTVEFAGNTIIFVLAGAVLGNICVSRPDVIGWSDGGYLLLLWAASNVTRLLMLWMLSPALRNLGPGVTPQEMLVMGWGGLRGAVGLALALSLQNSAAVSRELGTQITFHVGGMAFLTLAVNGTTVAPLLRYLGMTRPSANSERLFELMEHHVKGRMRGEYRARTKAAADGHHGGGTYEKHSRASVEDVVSALCITSPIAVPVRALGMDAASAAAATSASANSAADLVRELGEGDLSAVPGSWLGASEQEQLRDMRCVFLRAVRAAYWEMVEESVLPKSSRAVRCLMSSVSFAMDDCALRIADWERLMDSCGGDITGSKKLVRTVLGALPRRLLRSFKAGLLAHLARLYEQEYYQCSCFVRAHRHARHWLDEAFGERSAFRLGASTIGDLVQRCVDESEAQEALARAALDQLDEVTRRSSESKQLAGELLATQRGVAEGLRRRGLVSEADAARLLERVEEDEAKLDRLRHAQAQLRARVAKVADGAFMLSKQATMGAIPRGKKKVAPSS